MALLADWLLEVDGKVFGTSWPEKGDVTLPVLDGQSETHSSKLSFGVSASDGLALKPLTGKTARLLDVNGHEVVRFRIDKVDPDLAILVAVPLTEEAPPRSNVLAERQVSMDLRSGSTASSVPQQHSIN